MTDPTAPPWYPSEASGSEGKHIAATVNGRPRMLGVMNGCDLLVDQANARLACQAVNDRPTLLDFIEDARSVLMHLRRLNDKGVEGTRLPLQEMEAAFQRLIARRKITTLYRPPTTLRPIVVCLCGSTRFIDEFNRQREALTLAGEIVLSIEIVTTQARDKDPQHVDPGAKRRLDALHLRKIDLADYILVLNVGGYIGESTAAEILYAEEHGKEVRYLVSSGEV